MEALIFSLALATIAAVAFLASKPLEKRILFTCALAAAVYIGADDFVTGLPSLVKGLNPVGAHWNWVGKLLSLVLSAIVIAALRLSPAAVGLTIKQRHTKTGLVALLLFIVWGSCLGLLFKPGVPDIETLLFQATMPGLSEELVYRGIAPAILLGLFRKQEPDYGMPWVVILSTAVAFGAWHGLKYSNGVFGFDAMSALFPFIGSIPGGWLRYKTGSLLFPILAHSFANVAFHVAGGFAA
jgi:membrane protease YdiL (CAAX protease family)